MPKRPEKVQKVQKGLTLGERIRSMREKQQMDLAGVSQKTGISLDQLQNIEEGKVAPPVGTLIQISRALAVDSSSLLAEDKKKERRQNYLKRTKAYAYKCVTPEAEDKHLWAYLVTLQPKKEHEMVAYKHEGEEFVYVLEGRVQVTVGEEAHVVKKGGTLHFDSNMAHHLKNLSSTQSKLLVVVYTP
jgi:quercetin dioxygenase-like cupin family protein